MDLLPPCVWHFLQERLTLREPLVSVQEAKSAQQTVLVLRLPPRSAGNVDDDADDWAPALARGRNRLVLRIWQGSARWWNLHSNRPGDGRRDIARQELAGYRRARQALRNEDDAARRPYIPQILHEAIENQPCGPWAILEYVGRDSMLFDGDMFDETWFHSMVKVRREFGFDEPHPRWGRVPVEQSLNYALNVLDQVVIPLHRYYQEEIQNEPEYKANLNADLSVDAVKPTVYTFHAIHKKYKTILQSIQASQCTDAKIREALEEVQKGLLRMETDSCLMQNLPPVLVHMDLQPQNILFAKQTGTNEDDGGSLAIISVLDWEEAAVTDPRFELLMLGRKVCANRLQADVVWDTYSKEMHVRLGSIEPWLRMETLHSLITLILQLLDLSKGGRSPWDTKQCWVLKIEREVERLSSLST